MLEVVDDVVDADVGAGEEDVDAEQDDEHVLGQLDDGVIGERPEYDEVENGRNGDGQIGAGDGANQRDEQIDARHAHGEAERDQHERQPKGVLDEAESRQVLVESQRLEILARLARARPEELGRHVELQVVRDEYGHGEEQLHNLKNNLTKNKNENP